VIDVFLLFTVATGVRKAESAATQGNSDSGQQRQDDRSDSHVKILSIRPMKTHDVQ
jgi:hypothetical protein